MADGAKYGCATTAHRFLLTFGSTLPPSHHIKSSFFNGLEISLLWR
jgi:hypothetical protein